MSLDNLQDIRFFNQVVRSQGFTAAANILQLPVNKVSRRVSQLENRMGVRLLNRTTRKLSLTAEGSVLFERSQRLLIEFDTLEEKLTNGAKLLTGTVRIAVRTPTVEFGFVEELSKELRTLDNLIVQLIVRDEPIDFIAEGIDLALMINDLPDSSLVQKKLGDVIFALCAAPDYFRGQNILQNPDELEIHHFISPLKKYPQNSLTLRHIKKKANRVYKIKPQFQSNDIRARARAIYAGLGVGNLPIAEVLNGVKDRSLVHVLPDYTLKPISVWSLKTADRKNDRRLQLIEKLLIGVGKRMCAKA
ncbi:MAG: LysR family transcriptional regulator [Pseudomonadales bacterium]|nr:LysR family transcriptional regulator [Pseudomonadales bacterium]